MNKLTISIVAFFLVLVVPLGYLVVQTFTGLAREEEAEFRFFAQTLLQDMDEELATFVEYEHARGIDQYHAGGNVDALEAWAGEWPFVLGYYQIEPSGAVRTVHAASDEVSASLAGVSGRLRSMRQSREQEAQSVRRELERLEADAAPPAEPEPARPQLAGRYLDTAKRKKGAAESAAKVQESRSIDREQTERFMAQENIMADMAFEEEAPGEPPVEALSAEVGPMETVVLDQGRVFLFRRVFLADAAYIQGVVFDLNQLLAHLAGRYFAGQPIADFAQLVFLADTGNGANGSEPVEALAMGAAAPKPEATVAHEFASPFGFVRGEVRSATIPEKPTRTMLTLAVVFLGAVVLAGLAAIYASARAVVVYARRRAGFVSSVTHELKTPLTNIRMYVDMLQQGMAADPDKERRYLGVVSSESARLTRLINNVLEFSKLESGNRPMDLREWGVRDVVAEAHTVMAEQLGQAGFTFTLDVDPGVTAVCDREALVQVLVNLFENSMKFGADSPHKAITVTADMAGDRVALRVVDAGPGIPEGELENVFEEFHRVEQGLVRKTKGTGIGLAIVRTLVQAMGGRIRALNGPDRGCVMEITLQTPSG